MRPRPSSNLLRLKRAVLSGLIVAILMISTEGFLINTGAHFPTSIDSRWTTSPPLIDGNMTSLEWSDATVVNLTSIPGNKLASYLLVKNDARYLYLCYDAIGDDSFDMLDTASMAFDTDHDGIETAGREDQFIAGFRVYSAHLISDGSGNWTVHDSPVNDSLPNHTGLAVAYGFGQSDFASNVHRIYEFRIPLPLLGVSPGDAIGFLAGSQYFAGVLDYSDFTQSTWPRRFLGPQSLDKFGTLNINAAPDIADLLVDPLEQWNIGEPGTSIDYVFTVMNEGTMAPDVFDFNVSSIWNVTLYDLLLGTPLTDTDSDGLNDTGSLDLGVGKAILARVDIPPTATGSTIALLNVSSSLDLAVHLLGRLYTEIPIARFTPPHNDYGIDLDSPPDGLYDYLRVEISVAVEVSGAYSFEGYLYDQSKTRVIANA
ncbi:MAG: hypothetical protein JSV43_04700 [Methanobacteriota archaeon]|nr:MAG: hypothetical protein JSV43_04700 [Euryarchaeota archaeon]